MRTGFAIFFLLLLGFPFWGTYGILLQRRTSARRAIALQIAEGAGQNSLVRLAFTKVQAASELEWEHSREFEYNGEMYDVVKSEAKGDSLIYHCIWDKAETAINRQLDNLVRLASNNNPQNKQDFKLLLDFFHSLFCEQIPNEHRFFAAPTTPTVFYRYALLTAYSPPAVPPPRAF